MTLQPISLLYAITLAAALTVTPSYSAPSEKDFIVALPEQIVWRDAGKGVKIALVYGDPSKPGNMSFAHTFHPV